MPNYGMPDPYYYPAADEEAIGGETLRQGDEEPTVPYYQQHQQQYPYNFQHYKVPLQPRREGEAPNFVFYKQHRRIQILRDKRKNQEISNKYFTRLRIVRKRELKFLEIRVPGQCGQESEEAGKWSVREEGTAQEGKRLN